MKRFLLSLIFIMSSAMAERLPRLVTCGDFLNALVHSDKISIDSKITDEIAHSARYIFGGDYDQWAKSILKKKGVEFDEAHEFGVTRLFIKPIENGEQLNQIAFFMKKHFNVSLSYSADELASGINGGYHPLQQRILLSHAALVENSIESNLFHELIHAISAGLERDGVNSIFYGKFNSTFRTISTDFTLEGYKTFLTFEEALTHILQSIYLLQQKNSKLITPSRLQIRLRNIVGRVDSILKVHERFANDLLSLSEDEFRASISHVSVSPPNANSNSAIQVIQEINGVKLTHNFSAKMTEEQVKVLRKHEYRSTAFFSSILGQSYEFHKVLHQGIDEIVRIKLQAWKKVAKEIRPKYQLNYWTYGMLGKIKQSEIESVLLETETQFDQQVKSIFEDILERSTHVETK